MSDGKKALVLFAHGSRDPQWALPFHAIREKVSKLAPGVTVQLAFLEIMEPALESVVSDLARSGHTHVTVAPLFMAQGAHLKRDLAGMLAALTERHPGIEITTLPALGEADPVLDAIGRWLADHV